ncbi:hypothetical protein RCL_jg576.t1 [Rhizophagus clarus]|uniref:Uncharacterized protein n=1 Tax=Rhizophagus clarus TaxID=94130 RepID=A0A8H3LLY6_9GLOM|nr:hypothetical protein RCL_jg576.t1 [Rhizophagus clarus]
MHNCSHEVLPVLWIQKILMTNYLSESINELGDLGMWWSKRHVKIEILELLVTYMVKKNNNYPETPID